MTYNLDSEQAQAEQTATDATEGTTQEEITDWCRQYVGELLERAPEEIDPAVGFDRLGLDSALAVSLLIEVEERFGVELPPQALFENPDLNSVAAYLYTHLPRNSAAR